MPPDPTCRPAAGDRAPVVSRIPGAAPSIGYKGAEHEEKVMEGRLDIRASAGAVKAVKHFVAANGAVHGSALPLATQELVKIRASQINGCGYCLDMHTKDATAAGETAQRLHLVAAWREAAVFTAAERAALALAEEGTRLADGPGVSDEVWDAAAEHYDDDQLGALVALIAVINAFNRVNVLVQRPAGAYEPAPAG